ncbi:MAG: TIGR03790 family protein, partial [Verrucomicrobia bacterium]|nr:TIGR03790 family protein [Verrucomicrobiota bacterium]
SAARRNEAAVDSELALLPLARAGYTLAGAFDNPHYGTTNSAAMHPTNGILLVARLDGPTADIARGLVDKALQAESDGLWGRAYFDARGLTNGPYLLGDEWIRGAASTARRFGFETVLDDKPETFPAAFPLSHVALYAGWYDANMSGPFARTQVEFMPGAIAYHLHSFSAQTLRTGSDHWVGPLLARGATATMGCVDEPFLTGTPNLHVFFERLMQGFTFGEAAYASQAALSWQTTVAGDPLYRPFGRSPRELHESLAARKSRLLDWSLMLIVNRNLAMGTSAAEMAGFLEAQPQTRTSAVLLEKLSDLHQSLGKPSAAADTTAMALRQEPSPQQKIRLLLTLVERRLALHDDPAAYDALKQLAVEAPDYSDRRAVLERLIGLAQKMGKADDATRWQEELKRR